VNEDDAILKELMKHFKNPKFVKKLKSPDAVGEVGNLRCGDIMRLKIKISDNKDKKILDFKLLDVLLLLQVLMLHVN